jgi:uncharacterized RDD family membrane protein YckC
MEENPYQPPQADLTTSTANTAGVLASPWIRLGAAIIDGIVLLPINFIIQKIFIKMPDPTEIYQAAAAGKDINAMMPSTTMMLVSQILGLAVLIGVNFNFLKKGQTIGKMLLKLQIQKRTDGSLLPVKDLILKRILPLYGLQMVGTLTTPMITGLAVLVDCLCIFRKGRNTIHDDIAGSKVVVLPQQ